MDYILKRDLPGIKTGTVYKQDKNDNFRYYPMECFDSNGLVKPMYGVNDNDVHDTNWFVPQAKFDIIGMDHFDTSETHIRCKGNDDMFYLIPKSLLCDFLVNMPGSVY